MIQTQIQLPDDLYERAMAFADARELSLEEITRRGLEIFLSRFPESPSLHSQWQLPRVDLGTIKVPLEDMKDLAHDEEGDRSLGVR